MGTKSNTHHEHYRVTVQHGESGPVFYVVDSSAPESEQPCIISDYSTSLFSERARELAEDTAQHLNEIGQRVGWDWLKG